MCGAGVDVVLARELATGREAMFADVDTLTTLALRRMADGTKIVRRIGKPREAQVELVDIGADERMRLDRTFSLAVQQARGAWFLPEKQRIRCGRINLPAYYRSDPRFAATIVEEDVASTLLADAPEAVYCWAVLEPLADALFHAFDLRGPMAGRLSRAEHMAAWESIDTCFAALNFAAGPALDRMRVGNGWSQLRVPEQLAIKQEVLAHIAAGIRDETAARYRIWALQPLLERFYAKAKNGTPLMRSVLSKPSQRTLAAFFGGDWLAFLNYLDERPHPDERIATSLPTPRLFVAAPAEVETVAAKHGIAPEEVQRMLTAFWGQPAGISPVLTRAHVLHEYWLEFDAIHAQQAPTMPSLWGLVADDSTLRIVDPPDDETVPINVPGRYRALLSSALQRRIQSAWDTIVLPQWPDRLVSSELPHAFLAVAFGPALRFWHGAALTAWFLCEGPSSRTDMAGLAKYHERDLAAMDALDCPIDAALFPALVTAQECLSEPIPIDEASHVSQRTVGGLTFSITVTTSTRTRREGFEQLRDVVTAGRREWARRHLANYLRQRWEGDLREVAQEFYKLFEEKGRAPATRQVARMAAETANAWFGGNLASLYTAIGEKAPIKPKANRLLPLDSSAFVIKVFTALGGRPTRWKELAATIVGAERAQQDATWRSHGVLKHLAERSIRFVQLWEALHRPPTLKEFGEARFVAEAYTLDSGTSAAWARYATTIAGCIDGSTL